MTGGDDDDDDDWSSDDLLVVGEVPTGEMESLFDSIESIEAVDELPPDPAVVRPTGGPGHKARPSTILTVQGVGARPGIQGGGDILSEAARLLDDPATDPRVSTRMAVISAEVLTGEEGKAKVRELIGGGLMVLGPDLDALLSSLGKRPSPDKFVLARFITSSGGGGAQKGTQFGVQVRGLRYRKAIQQDLVELEGVLRRVRSPDGELWVELGLRGVPVELPTYSTATGRGYFVARESLPEHRIPNS